MANVLTISGLAHLQQSAQARQIIKHTIRRARAAEPEGGGRTGSEHGAADSPVCVAQYLDWKSRTTERTKTLLAAPRHMRPGPCAGPWVSRTELPRLLREVHETDLPGVCRGT